MTSPIGLADRLCAVIGSPVRHSLSPAIHTAAFGEAGLDWSFARFELVPGGVAAAVAAMGPLGIAGYAVTMPHKVAAAAAVDAIDDVARALDSVNTISLRDDGSTVGASTDGQGFVAWVDASGFDVCDARVVVLGAGAAARSIVDALGRHGAADIAIVNRTATAAERAAELAAVARVGAFGDVAAADLVVNATSVGMGSSELPLAPDTLHDRHVVADIVYHPLDTALLCAARERGAATIDGLGMLVHQAVLQAQIWTGHRPDPEVLRRAAEAELSARSERAHG